jgi:hypothetical protein
MPKQIEEFKPGQRVRITQQIPQRDDVWVTHIEGQVVKAEQRKTGSWFAHSRDDKLWLDRLVLRKDDGEIVVINLDRYTHADILSEPADASKPASNEAQEEAEAGNAD